MNRKIKYQKLLVLSIKAKGGKLLTPYVRSDVKVSVKCKQDHIFSCTPKSIKSGKWCSECPIQKKINAKNIIEKKGGELLSKYSRETTIIRVRCGRGHIFKTTQKKVLLRKWCPMCSGSRGEIECSVYLNSKGIEFFKEVKGKNLEKIDIHKVDIKNRRFDFYVPSHNLLIEYDGRQHFSDIKFYNGTPFKERQKIDKDKTIVALECGYNVLRIDNNSSHVIRRILGKTLELIKLDINSSNLYITSERYSYLDHNNKMVYVQSKF
ncbi:MAG: hypothetical protein COA94_08870 [Rickettsiales bacterium]|nr:MAG: hypothetical protein COA94_08870 [Rickettsiales bacterium]